MSMFALVIIQNYTERAIVRLKDELVVRFFGLSKEQVDFVSKESLKKGDQFVIDRDISLLYDQTH